jgi:hypothetical protein
MGFLAVVVFLSVGFSHFKGHVVSCSGLCIRTMAGHKETEELRGISVDHATSEYRASGVDESKNTLTREQGMTSASLKANFAVNNTNDCGDIAGCTTRDSIANGVNLKVSQALASLVESCNCS